MVESSSARRSVFPNKTMGFTLLEVMIVVAIVAILSAIAYPSYLSYKVRANRAAAQSVLMDLASSGQASRQGKELASERLLLESR